MRLRPLLTLLLPCLLLAGCGKQGHAPFSSDPMLGCFATGARKAPEFRLDREGGQYFVSFKRDAGWERDPSALGKASTSEISQFFRDDADKIESALIRPAGGFGIFKFREGTSLKGKASDSDYMALVLIGAGPVYPMACD